MFFLPLTKLTAFLLSIIGCHRCNAADDDDDNNIIPVRLSHQVAYWAIPPYIAEKEGYFDELGLNVTFISYPSGAPQVADLAKWDIGATGTVPAIIGAEKGIQTVGISNDEAAANALVSVSGGEWPPSTMEFDAIALTPSSTGELAVKECLVKAGINTSEPAIFYGQPSEVLDALENGTTTYGGLWAPHLYTYLERGDDDRSVVCNGKDAGIVIPGAIVVDSAWGTDNKETAAKVLAAWLRGIQFVKAADNKQAVLSYAQEFYKANGIEISDEATEQDMSTRPLFGLDEQIQALDENAPGWFNDVATFMNEAGVVQAIPDTKDYITSDYMTMVKDDEVLSKYANGEDVDMGEDGMATSAPSAASAAAVTTSDWGMIATMLASCASSYVAFAF